MHEVTDPVRSDRTECNHPFKWDSENGCWKTTQGQLVLVRPPSKSYGKWEVYMPKNGRKKVIHSENPEFAAFSEADLWSRRR